MSTARSLARHGRALALALGTTLPIGAAPAPRMAAPWIVVVSGPGLPRRAVIADWHANATLLHGGGRAAPPPWLVEDRPYHAVALFWGPRWARYPHTREALARLDPDSATQRGRLYLARGRAPATLVLEDLGSAVPVGPFVPTTVTVLSADALAVLRDHGVPVSADATR